MLYQTRYFSALGLRLLNHLPYSMDSQTASNQQANQLSITTQALQQPNSHTSDTLQQIISPYNANTQPEWPVDLFYPSSINMPRFSPLKQPSSSAKAIVVLGGGLTWDQHKNIVVNYFTASRLHQAVRLHKRTGLPLLLSGVEAPYMQNWLLAHGYSALYKESNSFNTCENARFSALLLLKYGGAKQVYLVTDPYHMPRAQRLFANNGIATIADAAPISVGGTPKTALALTQMHSRRTLYELMANLRDYVVGVNCRLVP